mmetsp:Transcript_54186/g.175141  ORF Transcript_54186/g.175141 Transcript_54186/m.175141 type:complete len:109 (-) Transcript_54186:1277-1603(-)
MSLGLGSRSLQQWTSVIRHHGRQSDWPLALGALQRMRSEKLRPSVITYNALISACSQGYELDTVRSKRIILIMQDMRRERLRLDVVTYNTTISALEKLRSWTQALVFF